MLLTLLVMVCLAQLVGCIPNSRPAVSLPADLIVEILYPTATTETEMGQSLKGIVKVSDKEGKVVNNAQVTLSFKDSEGRLIASIRAIFGNGDVYRSEAWNIPHKTREGVWTLSVEAETDTRRRTVSAAFRVKN